VTIINRKTLQKNPSVFWKKITFFFLIKMFDQVTIINRKTLKKLCIFCKKVTFFENNKINRVINEKQ